MKAGLIIGMGVLMSAGLGLCGLGFFLGYSQFTNDLIAKEVSKQTMLIEDSEQYERWEELPFPFEFKIFIFNVTNPEEVVKDGAKPIVQEIGPFVYHEYVHKENVRYKEDDDTYYYNQFMKLEFAKDKSAFDETQMVTVLNMPLQGVFLNEERGMLPAEIQSVGVDLLWSKAFHGDGIFVNVSVHDFFFKGYQFCQASPEKKDRSIWEMIMHTATKIPIKMFCEEVKRRFSPAATNPIIVADDQSLRFSMFNHKHDNNDGRYQIKAGKKDIFSLGEITSWNNKEYLDVWEGNKSECNRVHGTDSAIYAPFRNTSTDFFTFNTDICRVVKLSAVDTTTFKGIPGIKATMGPENMENDGENSCYCIHKTPDLNGKQNCFPKGFCDMHNCLKAPVVISYPHMLWGDEQYRNTVEGLHPNEEDHTSFLAIEPNTGTPLQSRKRMQFNMVLRKVDPIRATANLRSSMMPVLWMEEVFDLPDDMADKLKVQYFNKMYLLDTAVYALIGFGLLCAVTATGLILFI